MMPGFDIVPFNDIPALEAMIAKNAANTCAFMVEPIQVRCQPSGSPHLGAAARKLEKHQRNVVICTC